MKQNRIYISFLATLIVLFSNGCTVNKRYHNSGMGIQWHLNLKPVNSCSKIGLDKKKKPEPSTHSITTNYNISQSNIDSKDPIGPLSETQKTTLIKPALNIESSGNPSNFYLQFNYTNDAIKIDKNNCTDTTDKPIRTKVMHQNAHRNANWSLVLALLGFTIIGMFFSPIAIYLGIKAYYQGVTYKNGLIKAIVGVMLGLLFLIILLLILTSYWGG